MELKNSIYALLNSSEKKLKEIQSRYNDNHHEIDSELEITIKHFLEDLRSSLDYLADQIFAENCEPNDQIKKYFPLYTKNEHAFKSHIGKHLPKLDKLNNTVYLKLEKMQYYNDTKHREWMKELRIVNEYKHEDFVEQHRHSKEVVEVGAKGKRPIFRLEPGASLVNLRLDGVPTGHLHVGSNLETPKVPGLEINKIKIQENYFTKLDKPVIRSLTRMLYGVKNIMTEFEN